MNKQFLNDDEWHHRREIYKFLEEICQDLDLTVEQIKRAKSAYEAVAKWLAGSLYSLLQDIDVYLQGSTALGTATRPLGRDEFDVDLVCLLLKGNVYMAPEEIKKIIGDRLRENTTYAKMLIEKKRCWRLNYAGNFHLDLSGTIRNIQCMNGGELITDKKLQDWQPTNPKGYRTLFEKRALLLPRMHRAFAKTEMHIRLLLNPSLIHQHQKVFCTVLYNCSNVTAIITLKMFRKILLRSQSSSPPWRCVLMSTV